MLTTTKPSSCFQSYIAELIVDRWNHGKYLPIATEVEAVVGLILGASLLTYGSTLWLSNKMNYTKAKYLEPVIHTGVLSLKLSIPRLAVPALFYGVYKTNQWLCGNNN